MGVVSSARSPTLGLGWAHAAQRVEKLCRTGMVGQQVLEIREHTHTPKWKECFLFRSIYQAVKKYEWEAQCGHISAECGGIMLM